MAATPAAIDRLHLLFVMDDRGRIDQTREPTPSAGPAFFLTRDGASCAWAVRTDITPSIVSEIAKLVAKERPTNDWTRPLAYAEDYAALLNGQLRGGPAFSFPEQQHAADQAELIESEADLANHFKGWVTGEIEDGRAPVVGLREGGRVVSVCFCARRTFFAAEAGVETAAAFRRRGHAAIVTAAWARHIRAQGMTPIYSTDWSNTASLAVARKLNLVPFATNFSIDTP